MEESKKESKDNEYPGAKLGKITTKLIKDLIKAEFEKLNRERE